MAIVLYVFIMIKTKNLSIKNKTLVKNSKEEVTSVIKIDNPNSQIRARYKISGRSMVIPEDITNKTKIVLLTIDDGPSSRTGEMIEILKKHNAKAIFFINGMHNKESPGVIENTIKEGYEIGNHTWSHLNLKKERDMIVSEKEINRNSDLIKNLTGKSPRFFRAPYGESNPIIRKYVKDQGMIFMDWSGAAMDWDKSTKEKDVFVNNVMNNIHSGSIILIHEHPWSIANLDALLTTIESKGYTYVDPKDIIE